MIGLRRARWDASEKTVETVVSRVALSNLA
jgi:hypothetical protein